MNQTALRDWTAVLAVLAAVGLIIYGLTAENGWIETMFLWPVYVFGLLMTGLALYKGAPKLLLMILPVFLVPMAMAGMLLYACTQGTCL